MARSNLDPPTSHNRTTPQMVDVSLNFPSFQRSSSLKAVVNWCQSNPEYAFMESIYQAGNKNQIPTGVILENSIEMACLFGIRPKIIELTI